MKQWHDMLHKVLTHGVERPDRTGVGTMALFGEQMTFDNSVSFPAVTTKELKFGQVKAELAAFLHGFDSLDDFHSVGCRIWDGNAAQTASSRFKPTKPGDLGRIYGVQWRSWTGVDRYPGGEVYTSEVDQMRNLIEGLMRDPFGRRHLVTAWNPAELDQMVLPPCHVMFQCFVRPWELGMTLDLRVDLRSLDLFLGAPFDIASYALLQRLIAKQVGMTSGKLTLQVGDCHVYLNHGHQVGTVLGRKPFHPPNLFLADGTDLFNFDPMHADLIDYLHHPAVPAPLNC